MKKTVKTLLLASTTLALTTTIFAANAHQDSTKKLSNIINNAESKIEKKAKKTSIINNICDDKSPFTAYELNYAIPAYYTVSPTDYDNILPGVSNNHLETKFQISVKARMIHNLFKWPVSFYFFYTQYSFWQFYNSSAYFRETNYNPGFFFHIKTSQHPFHLASFDIGVMHQSNGRGGDNERSWNRAYLNFNFLFGSHWALSIKPWYRIQHFLEVKDYNPDITEYLGYGLINLTYYYKNFRATLMLRNILESGFARGAEELDVSIPVYHHLHGFIQVFSGYGQSLISYNHYTNGAGAGFSLYDEQTPFYEY